MRLLVSAFGVEHVFRLGTFRMLVHQRMLHVPWSRCPPIRWMHLEPCRISRHQPQGPSRVIDFGALHAGGGCVGCPWVVTVVRGDARSRTTQLPLNSTRNDQP